MTDYHWIGLALGGSVVAVLWWLVWYLWMAVPRYGADWSVVRNSLAWLREALASMDDEENPPPDGWAEALHRICDELGVRLPDPPDLSKPIMVRKDTLVPGMLADTSLFAEESLNQLRRNLQANLMKAEDFGIGKPGQPEPDTVTIRCPCGGLLSTGTFLSKPGVVCTWCSQCDYTLETPDPDPEPVLASADVQYGRKVVDPQRVSRVEYNPVPWPFGVDSEGCRHLEAGREDLDDTTGQQNWTCYDCATNFTTDPGAVLPSEAATVGGSDECDECDGSGTYYIDGKPRPCICSEPQTAEPGSIGKGAAQFMGHELDPGRIFPFVPTDDESKPEFDT